MLDPETLMGTVQEYALAVAQGDYREGRPTGFRVSL